MRDSTLSIIIPTFNEAERIESLIVFLREYAPQAKIWVANSPKTTDATAHLAQRAGAKVLECPVPGRGSQMNFVARHCSGQVFYFVHADVIPPSNFYQIIERKMATGHTLGYFSYQFDCGSSLLRINSFCTRFHTLLSGGGDQTLFIQKSTFEQLGGFDESLSIMEDFDLIRRAKGLGHQPQLVCEPATVSARKYEYNSWMKVNTINLLTFLLFLIGAPQSWLVRLQKSLQ